MLCPPIFHESANTHRALRSLGELLAKAGIHALRFDYRGTGDSAGEGTACRVADWIDDVGAAVDDLRGARGLSEVGLVGIRFGGTLAAQLAARRPDLPFLVLWEPIVAGASYVEELRTLQQRWVDFEAEQRPAARRDATDEEVLGHPLSAALAADLAAVELGSAGGRLADRLLLLDEEAGTAAAAYGRRLEQSGVRVERRRVDSGRLWEGGSAGGDQASVPRAVLSQIVEWVVGEASP